jgi:hypothetical protein
MDVVLVHTRDVRLDEELLFQLDNVHTRRPIACSKSLLSSTRKSHGPSVPIKEFFHFSPRIPFDECHRQHLLPYAIFVLHPWSIVLLSTFFESMNKSKKEPVKGILKKKRCP